MASESPRGPPLRSRPMSDADVPTPDLMEKIVNLSKRRGFVFPSAEIYGGFRSTYDYGPIGVLLLRNVKDAWWRSMVQLRDDVVGLDAAILSPPAIWQASGHLANFTDPLVDCKVLPRAVPARQARRSAHLPELRLEGLVHRGPPVQPHVQDPRRADRRRRRRGVPAPRDGPGHVRRLRQRAADQPQEAAVRHRPGRQVVPQRDHARQLRVPHPRVRADGDGVLRPARRGPAVVRVLVPRARTSGTSTSGIPADKLRLRPHDADELSHYSSGTSDVEFLFPWGWDELEGIANRGDYDLTQHMKASGEKLDYFDQATNTRYTPHVIEPAAGATRTMMAFLLAAYDEEEVRGETRVVLRLHHRLAPYKVAVLPLSKKDTLTPLGPRRARRRSSRTSCATTTRPRPSAAATAARTSWARRTASPSTSTRSTTRRSPCASATRWTRTGCPSTTWSGTSVTASPDRG